MADMKDNFPVHTFGIQIDGVQLEQLKEVSGIGFEQEVITSQHVTDKGAYYIRKQPGPRKPGELTITRGMDQNKALNEWIKQTYEKGDIPSARKNVTIEMKDNTGATKRRITMQRAWVSSWDGGTITAGSSDAVNEKVTIQYEEIKVEDS
ncbi:phage tail protein [Streptomyces kronopolitis]|uniref:phage tail protein n=1 Tax=Streptomyces kronopolitis TaxID=1612435 RepID=UPI0036C92E74